MPRPRSAAWPAIATALAAAVPLDELHPRVRAWVAAHRRSRRPWSIAFSGGSDSLALLLLVWAHWPERRAALVALHFNHRLRGAAARADARFCAKVCRALGVELRTGRWERPPSGAGEAQARAARMAFFAAELRRLRGTALWLGQQQDDVAETLLMRLARGSGTAGLAAPRPVQPFPDGRVHLRPLLGLSRARLVAALRQVGAEWREDATNAAPTFFRNRLRSSVLPAWIAAAGRDAVAGAALARERLEEDDAALEAWLDDLDVLTPGRALRLDRLAGRPVALWRRALHRWLLRQPHQSDLSRHGFAELLSKLQAREPTRFSLGRGYAVITRDQLSFEPGDSTKTPPRRPTRRRPLTSP